MPPWLPASGRGEFAGERRLSTDEIGRIAQWAQEGAPPGDLPALAPPPEWPEGWQLGQPDLIVEMDVPYHVVGGAAEEFRNFVLHTDLAEPRWVRAIELLPGNPSIVHHAMLMVDPTPASRLLEDGDSTPGYDGMHPGGSANVPQGFFLGWTPGRLPSAGEEGLSWALDPGANLVLQLHLRPGAVPDSVRARIGLHFDTRPPTRLVTTIRLASETMDIPAGESRYVIEDSYYLPVDVELLGLYPHAHYLGRAIEAWADLPDRSRRWLIDIPDWDFNWQDEYRFTEPVALPRGTRLMLRLVYDNSEHNPRNPSTPPQRVVYGPRSLDEMGDLWISLQLRDSLAMQTLHRDYARKEFDRRVRGWEQMVRIDPSHPDAHGQLGHAMLSVGRLDVAIRHYSEQLAVTPDDGAARYNLALALHSAGRLDEAIAGYRAALAVSPNHASVHNNLGNALLASGQLDEAVAQYRAAVATDPTLADAHHNLGIALVGMGRIGEGLRHSSDAARLRPEWAAPLAVMAWTLSTHPDASVRRPARAVELAEEAALITGRGDPSMLNTLAAAYAAAGEYGRAVVTAEEAMQLALARGASTLANEIAGLISIYRTNRPYREQPRLGIQ
jgi:tetratricopeptide (TPR) repeat protein